MGVRTAKSASRFIDHHEWQGTRDISAYLTVPAAIRFMEQNDWEAVSKRCHDLLREFIPRILDATGEPAIAPDSSEWIAQMASFVIPTDQWKPFRKQLYDDYQIEAPSIRWNNHTLLRISVNAYHIQHDFERLADAVKQILDLRT